MFLPAARQLYIVADLLLYYDAVLRYAGFSQFHRAKADLQEEYVRG